MRLFLVSIFFLQSLISWGQTNYTPKVSSGSIVHLKNFASAYVPSRDIDILLPADYYTSTNRYPVVYMCDGQMLFDTTNTWNHQEWQVDEVLQRLTDSNKISPFIVVAIHNISRLRYAELYPIGTINYLPEANKKLMRARMNDSTDANKFLTFITKEVKLFVDNNYRTMTGASHTCIAGSSMGGLFSWYAACESPMTFGKAICLSTHWPGTNPTQNEAKALSASFQKYLTARLPEPHEVRFWFGHGAKTLDSFYAPHQKEVNQLIKKKKFTPKTFQFKYYPNDAHDEKSWANQIDEAFLFMFGKGMYP